MASHRHFVPTLIFLLFAGLISVFAQSSTARFVYFRPNAISSAIGGIGVAYFHDAYSCRFNPAGLAFSPTLSVAGSFDEPLPIFPGEGYSFFGASGNLGGLIAVGLSTNLYWKGNEAKTYSDGRLRFLSTPLSTGRENSPSRTGPGAIPRSVYRSVFSKAR